MSYWTRLRVLSNWRAYDYRSKANMDRHSTWEHPLATIKPHIYTSVTHLCYDLCPTVPQLSSSPPICLEVELQACPRLTYFDIILIYKWDYFTQRQGNMDCLLLINCNIRPYLTKLYSLECFLTCYLCVLVYLKHLFSSKLKVQILHRIQRTVHEQKDAQNSPDISPETDNPTAV